MLAKERVSLEVPATHTDVSMLFNSNEEFVSPAGIVVRMKEREKQERLLRQQKRRRSSSFSPQSPDVKLRRERSASNMSRRTYETIDNISHTRRDSLNARHGGEHDGEQAQRMTILMGKARRGEKGDPEAVARKMLVQGTGSEQLDLLTAEVEFQRSLVHARDELGTKHELFKLATGRLSQIYSM